MKNEIIALYSGKNTGKTTSIRGLFKRVTGCYDIKECMDSDGKSVSVESVLNNPSGEIEIKCYISLKNNTIGFASDGDDPKIVKGNLAFFSMKGCNICITACSLEEMIKQAKRIKQANSTEEKYNVSFFDFYHLPSARQAPSLANEEKVELMFSRLRYLI